MTPSERADTTSSPGQNAFPKAHTASPSHFAIRGLPPNLSHSTRKVAPHRRPLSPSIVGDQHLARPALAGVAEGEPGAGCRHFRFSFTNGS